MENDSSPIQNIFSESDAMERRVELLDSVRSFLANEREIANADRAAAFQPDMSSVEGYATSLAPWRAELRKMLGWPLTASPSPVSAECKPLAEDELGRIYQVGVQVNRFEIGRAHV